MIPLKTQEDLKHMRHVGRLSAQLLHQLGEHLKPGMHTDELNTMAVTWAKKHKVTHAPLHYHGFPKSICTSVNNVVCHGIPQKDVILEEGDIINIDVTLIKNGYHGDTSKTFLIGDVTSSTKQLVQRAQKAMYIGIQAVRPYGYLHDIGRAIADYLEPFGYGIVEQLGGHGIGKKFHEAPYVPYHRQSSRGVRLKTGMVLTIEPMINEGSPHVYTDANDGWTVYTQDSTLSAQFEHTIAITKEGVEILTLP